MPHVIARDGTRLHYRTAGTRGPAVVLVQGLGLSGRFWFDIPAQLAARGARVAWLDNRGTGKSDDPRRPFTMRTFARDVISVMDDVGFDRATLVGVSMGGMICQNVAVRYPERVDGLVLMATTPGLPHGRLPHPKVLSQLARLPFTKGRAGGELAAKVLLPPSLQSDFHQIFARWPAAFAADPQRPRSFFMQLGAVASHTAGRYLHQVDVPTMVITGKHDILVPTKNSEILARLIPGAELEILDDVAHAVPMQRPDVVERALDRIWALRGVKPAPQPRA